MLVKSTDPRWLNCAAYIMGQLHTHTLLSTQAGLCMRGNGELWWRQDLR